MHCAGISLQNKMAAGGSNTNKRSQNTWDKFARDMKVKRMKPAVKKPTKANAENIDLCLGASILKQGEMIVQQLESEPSGKAKKYERVGAQEFVKFDHEDVTIDNIKEACERHFSDRVPPGMECNVLASQRGPSCTKVSHLCNFKLIHVRFIKKDSGISSFRSRTISSKSCSREFSRVAQFSPFKTNVNNDSKTIGDNNKNITASSYAGMPNIPNNSHGSNIPNSISVATMLKIGKVISKVDDVKSQQVELSDFSIKNNCSWIQPYTVEMRIEKESFASGGFREVYKASLKDATPYVVKKFLPSSIVTIQELNELGELNETTETFARRAVQAHMLAKNFADQFRASLVSHVKTSFGSAFSYGKATFGKILETGEVIMVEDFIPGKFSKYINNDGKIIHDAAKRTLTAKAECLAHFTYTKSEKELLLVDIQGCQYKLFDPEIASVKGLMDDGGFRFSIGNLSYIALKNFKTLHKCNQFCKLAGLTEIEEET